MSAEPGNLGPPPPRREVAPVDSTAHAYREVRTAILDGTLAPGAAFSQVQLAAQLEISRTPLREALRLLQNEGLVASDFNRRVRVSELTLDDLEQVYALRLAAEPLGVRLTVPTLTDVDLGRLVAAVETLEAHAESESADARVPHREFHFVLFAGAGPRLGGHIADLWEHAERYRLLYDSAVARRAVRGLAEEEHRGILAAAQARDGVLCADRVAAHLARTALTIIARADGRREPRVVREALRLVTGAR